MNIAKLISELQRIADKYGDDATVSVRTIRASVKHPVLIEVHTSGTVSLLQDR